MNAGSATLTKTDGIGWIVSSAWAYPALESMHIVGIALLLGHLVLFEARVWGAASELPLWLAVIACGRWIAYV